MTRQNDNNTRLRVAHLNPRQPTEFRITPDAEARKALAAELDLLDLPKLDFAGAIRAKGTDAWELTGQLTARVVQPCVVTLAPVKTDLSEPVHRIYSPHAATPEGEEVEMPDEEVDLLGQFIDLRAVMIEALELALPLYPRAAGAELPADEAEDADAEIRRPFAGLADLLKQKQ
ncbi:YceD family protein [Paracoccus aminophilus]|uniref:DUF177 domain-containing protein n=1 Tax=Paracoccus aminophilus JCM 7686 TaxID=1367847 RepID=S5Y9F9_PARAH|nr:DUF177 domain-containing protein [Paracoccus aminophilus]AGT07988.1 hypothetical protein JCM7686_0879 [Paracoccus aminophilus JCM 7686]